MKAPEKIYLTKNLLGELRDGWDALPSEVFTNIEYTRTDAFIEKACDWLRIELVNFEDYIGMGETFIEDFKNYMKGKL